MKQDICECCVDQGTAEWHAVRAGKITCSNFGVLMGSAANKNSYLEEIRSGNRMEINSPATNWGKAHEKEAFGLYFLTTGNPVRQCGFISRLDFPCAGGSPDGKVLAGDVYVDVFMEGYGAPGRSVFYNWGSILGGVEIKCPYDPAIHQIYRKTGCPYKYFWQIHGYMWLTGADWWDFVSYDPRAEKDERIFIQRILRDAGVVRSLDVAVAEFSKVLINDSWYAELDARSAILSGQLDSFLPGTKCKIS